MTQSKINFCTLNSYRSIEELLNKELSFSKSYLKKLFKKNFLNKDVMEKDELTLPLNLLNRGMINPVYKGFDIEILKEDENFLSLNKPAGIHGHPLEYEENETILNFIRSKFKIPHLSLIQDQAESTLLYRLDRETSGVLIFAKNIEVYSQIRNSFQDIAKKKTYLAIVRGNFNREGIIKHDLIPYGEKGAMMKAQTPTGSCVEIEASKVHYNSEENVSLVKIKLGRGVRHQIRCQLGAVGFPILGDELYGGEKSDRVFLHAYEYSFKSDQFNFVSSTREAELFFKFFDLNSCL